MRFIDQKTIDDFVAARERDVLPAIGDAADEVPVNPKKGSISYSMGLREIRATLEAATTDTNEAFQLKYAQAEQALFGKLISLLVICFGAFILISFIQISALFDVARFQDAQSQIGVAAALYPIAALIFWGRVIVLAMAFFDVRRIRMLKEALSLDAQLNQGKKMIEDLKKRAGTIRVGKQGIYIGGDNLGAANTGTQIQIHQGAEAANVIALLLEYTKANTIAHAHATELALEASEAKPDRSKMFAAWTAIVALIPQVKDVVEIADGIAKLFGLSQ